MHNIKLRKVKKTMMIFLVTLCVFMLLVINVIEFFRLINANKIKIDTDNGIQENIYVEIGGIKQYLQIRGEDSENPVILWLHGGPGFPLTYLSYYYQTDLEKDYTIVCWEQRGCGRTYYENEISGELTIEQLLSDMDEVVDYLRKRFDQEKIIIMGQSWGTVLGMNYIHSNSEKVSAYIGIGQVIDFSKGKVHAAECAVKKAKECGNDEEAVQLNHLVQQFDSTDNVDNMNIEALENMIMTSQKYLKCEGELSSMKQMFTALTSSEMLWNDVRWFLYASSTKNIVDSQKALIDYMYFGFDVEDFDSEYGIPICFIQGDNDWITPTDMVSDYYSAISAENKDMIAIENAGHTPFLDNPEEFCNAVKNFLSECEISNIP